MNKRSRESSFSSTSSSSREDITTAVPNPAASFPTSHTAPREKSTKSVSRTSKYTHLDSTATKDGSKLAIMKCLLPSHGPLSFTTYEDYEVHYRQYHMNRCTECGRNFPSNHYLYLHIAERHDPLVEAKRAKGDKTYACFVEDCDKICRSALKRRWHCTAKHQFPKDYDFFIVKYGLDKRNSMLRAPKPSHSDKYRRASTNTADSSESASFRGKSPRTAIEKSKQNGKDKAESHGNVNITSTVKSAASTRKFPTKSIGKTSEDDDSEDEDEDMVDEHETESEDEDSDETEDSDSNSISDKDMEDRPKSKSLPTANATSKASTSGFEQQPITTLKSSTNTKDASMDSLTKSMSALQFVPRSLQFGRGRGKAGFARR